jgi:hypothetical protein
MARRWLGYRYRRYVNLAPNYPLCLLLAPLGRREMSDLRPQSGPKRTLIQVAVTDRDFMKVLAAPRQCLEQHPDVVRDFIGRNARRIRALPTK